MPKGIPIDIELLHHMLWTRADRLGRVKLVQHDLAIELGVTKFTMSRVVTRLIEEGRIRRITTRGNNAGQFIVNDPVIGL